MRTRIVALLALALACGCSGKKEDEGPTLQPVTGRIVHADGSSWTGGGTIELNGKTDPSVRAIAQITPEGEFKLTHIDRKGVREGAPSGEYTATIVPDQSREQLQPFRARGTYKIVAGETTELKIVIDRPKR